MALIEKKLDTRLKCELNERDLAICGSDSRWTDVTTTEAIELGPTGFEYRPETLAEMKYNLK